MVVTIEVLVTEIGSEADVEVREVVRVVLPGRDDEGTECADDDWVEDGAEVGGPVVRVLVRDEDGPVLVLKPVLLEDDVLVVVVDEELDDVELLEEVLDDVAELAVVEVGTQVLPEEVLDAVVVLLEIPLLTLVLVAEELVIVVVLLLVTVLDTVVVEIVVLGTVVLLEKMVLDTVVLDAVVDSTDVVVAPVEVGHAGLSRTDAKNVTSKQPSSGDTCVETRTSGLSVPQA